MVGALPDCGADLEDAKAGQVGDLAPFDLDVLHVCSRRPGAAPLDDSFDRRARPFEDGLDAAVGAVADPPGNALATRLTVHPVAEEHALHDAAHHHARVDYTWHAAQKNVERLL